MSLSQVILSAVSCTCGGSGYLEDSFEVLLRDCRCLCASKEVRESKEVVHAHAREFMCVSALHLPECSCVRACMRDCVQSCVCVCARARVCVSVFARICAPPGLWVC
jgi:hypothetical protein